jgi:thymidylate synthase (FAD)
MKVELLDTFGDDLRVCDAARVSFKKLALNFSPQQNNKLLLFLAKEGHVAPFYHPKLTYRISCPIYVERQITKTSIGVDLGKELDIDINSVSGRYVDFSDTYTKIEDWRKQSTSSKQGSEGLIDDPLQAREIENNVIEYCKQAYQQLITLGVSKEQARTVLPLNLNTEFMWTGSLYALIRLCQLRLAKDAQIETANVVKKMLSQAKESQKFGMSLKAFNL